MKLSLALITLTIAAPAWAKTDVKQALTALQTNEENAKANQKQYDANAEIASKNIVEVTTAVKDLRDQRARLVGSAANLQKNRAILEKVKEKLDGFRKEEDALLKREAAQILALKAQLAKLEANQTKRQQNLETYAQKIAEVEKERTEWDQQHVTFGAVQKEIDGKEQKALAERERWIEKRRGYRAEAAKWEKESQVAEQTRVKFDRLAD